jgi:hypothetical protein
MEGVEPEIELIYWWDHQESILWWNWKIGLDWR